MRTQGFLWASTITAVGVWSIACSNVADDCKATYTCPVPGRGGNANGSAGEAGANASSGGTSSGGTFGKAGEGGQVAQAGSAGSTSAGGRSAVGGSTASGGSSELGGDAGETAGGGISGSTGGAANSQGGTNGSSGFSNGGTTSSGGSIAGGSTGSGGTISKGGTTGSGGATSKGGTTSSGGTTSKGGATGSGGSTGQCGNAKLEGEGCDDGNLTAGDGCSKSCAIEAGWACPGGTATTRSVCNRSCAGTSVVTCQAGDCCESPLVTGGTFQQGEPDAFASTVSDFRLDRYEVTVGRFRKFVDSYDAWRSANKPAAGEGANASIGGSGWKSAWGNILPANAAGLASNLKCDSAYQTWVDGPGNDKLPINCVNWYEAFAFCIWDGGRLPTESEWEYAAAGGDSDYLYPWGNGPVLDGTAATASLAVYNCLGDGLAACSFTDILPVGSKPAGQGRYLQRDLSGSMSEWVLDWHADYPAVSSSNYARLEELFYHVRRGGEWEYNTPGLASAVRSHDLFTPVTSRSHGFRCARAR